MKRYLNIFLLFLLVTSVLAACSNSASTKVKDDASDENIALKAEGDSQVKAEVADGHLKIGESSKIKTLTIKLVNVREIKEDFIKPANGKFIGVELEVTNHGEKPVVLETLLQMALRVDGENQDLALVETLGSLDTEVAPGTTVKGEVAFDSKVTDTYEFVFTSPISSGQAIWMFHEIDFQQK